MLRFINISNYLLKLLNWASTMKGTRYGSKLLFKHEWV